MSAALTRARKLRRASLRRQSGRFLAEGAHVIAEALATGHAPLEAFVCRARATGDVIALAARIDAPLHDVTPRELAGIADTETPQGLVVVLAEPPPPPAPFARPGLWLALDRVRDPGNAGTLLRAAEAFGACGIMALPGTVDLWSPKSVRAGQGAHFHLHVLSPDPVDGGGVHLAAFRAAGGELWVAETGGEPIYDAPPPPALCALALGNEADGLDDDLLAAAARRVTVPQRGRTESLNVAMAGVVLLSWMARGARTP